MWRVLKEAALGAVGQVPGRAHQRVKVVEPVLVKLVARLANFPVQTIVQNLWRNCIESPSVGEWPHLYACCLVKMQREGVKHDIAVHTFLARSTSLTCDLDHTVGGVARVQHSFEVDLVPNISSCCPKAISIPAIHTLCLVILACSPVIC